MVSDRAALAPAEKAGSSEQSKVFIQRGKTSAVHVDGTRADLGERESCPCGSLNHFYGVFLPGFLWLIILICLDHSPYFLYLRILPCVRTHLLAKVDPAKASGTSLDIAPLWSPRSLSVYVWFWESLLTSGKRLM